MRPLVAALAALLAVLLPASAPAAAPQCPNLPLPDRYDAADLAFVGRLVSTHAAGGEQYWRFVVQQAVRGPLGGEVDVRAATLTDREGTPLRPGVTVGVLATLDGAVVAADSCGLVDPAALLAVADEPQGNLIKLAIGFVVLGAVVGYSLWRVRRRRPPGTGSTLAA